MQVVAVLNYICMRSASDTSYTKNIYFGNTGSTPIDDVTLHFSYIPYIIQHMTAMRFSERII
jgi:hypothetical protein